MHIDTDVNALQLLQVPHEEVTEAVRDYCVLSGCTDTILN